MSISRSRQRQKKRKQEERRRRIIVAASVVGALAVILVVFIAIANRPAPAEIPEIAFTRYEGIERNTSDEGFEQLGDEGAPVRLIEFSSFNCPACADFHDNVFVELLDRIRDGEVLFTYAPVALPSGIPNASGAARAALCAGEQDRFWEFHDALFLWQRQYVNQAFTSNRIESGIRNLGIDTTAWNNCMNSGRPGDIVQTAQEEILLVVESVSTPTLLINGQPFTEALTLDNVNAAIDEALLNVPEPEETPPDDTEAVDGEEIEVTDEPEEVTTEDETSEDVEDVDAEATDEEPAPEAEESDGGEDAEAADADEEDVQPTEDESENEPSPEIEDTDPEATDEPETE